MRILLHLTSKCRLLTLLFFVLVMMPPSLVLATNHNNYNMGTPASEVPVNQNPAGYNMGTPAPQQSGGLQNPLDPSISSIPAFFLAILDILLVFAIPFIVFFIIYAGFLYVTARGNVSIIEQAHRTLLYALIGGLLILGARGILNIITNTVNTVVQGPAIEQTHTLPPRT